MLSKYFFSKLKPSILLSLASIVSIFNYSSASAQTASISGSATLTINPTITTVETRNNLGLITGRTTTEVGGFTSSVAGESVLPTGMFYGGPVVVTPTYANSLVSTLSVAGGTIGVVPANTTFNRATAEILTNAATGNISLENIELVSTIIRAGAGINGLD